MKWAPHLCQGPSGTRALYYAQDFLIDFPCTPLAFGDTQEDNTQTDSYGTHLATRHEMLGSTTVSAVLWHIFQRVMDFLQDKKNVNIRGEDWSELEKRSSMNEGLPFPTPRVAGLNDVRYDPPSPIRRAGIVTPPP